MALRLEELPLIRAAFAEGRLSYSKVRALTRVEKVVAEEQLLSMARHATAAQLERLVRAYRGVVARARAAEDGGPERWVRWDHADDGSLLLRARLPAEEGAVVLEALQAGVERLGASAEAPPNESRTRAARARSRFRGSAARRDRGPRSRFRGSAGGRCCGRRAASAEAPRRSWPERSRSKPLPRKRPRRTLPSVGARFRGSAVARASGGPTRSC